MATIPYWNIAEKLKELFESNSKTALAKITIESSLQPTIDVDKHIAIYLKVNTREPVVMGQGNNSRECVIEYDIECNTNHAGSLQESFTKRDELLADIENMLQKIETLQALQTIPTDTFIERFEVVTTTFETPQENSQEGFISRGIITIHIIVRA